MSLKISIPIEMPKLEKMTNATKMPTIRDIMPFQMDEIPELETEIPPRSLKKEVASSKKELPVINRDASNLLAEILKIAASEIVKGANEIAHDNGRNIIEIADIKNAIHKLEG